MLFIMLFCLALIMSSARSRDIILFLFIAPPGDPEKKKASLKTPYKYLDTFFFRKLTHCCFAFVLCFFVTFTLRRMGKQLKA